MITNFVNPFVAYTLETGSIVINALTPDAQPEGQEKQFVGTISTILLIIN